MKGKGQLLGVGVDGAPGGWVVACCFGASAEVSSAGRRSEPRFFSSIAAFEDWRSSQPGGHAAPVAIDIPIGLPDAVGFRACDREARETLGKRRDCVFHPPARYLLAAGESSAGKPPTAKQVFNRVQELVAARKDSLVASTAGASGPVKVLGLSQQGAGILLKIAEVDAFLLAHENGQPPRRDRFFEVHPELCFAAMNADTVLPPKPTAHGQLLRLDLVRDQFPDAEQSIRAWEDGARYSLLDVCDAYAACWTALRLAQTGGLAQSERGRVTPALRVLGEEAPGQSLADPATGLPMRMVV